ncbi:MAG: selenocysteine-specific translation elongation factor [Halieaceae bacterium]|nr:selenocysteine-specific translation elongation factor [Halieaceae bacterium]
MIVATAGHVDHGKTSLVKALTGVDTDRLEEEKRRGLSINLGFAYRQLEGGASIGFIDVPGHRRFINTMIAGASGIDLALVVVAADDGPMPQTYEHLDVLTQLGVKAYILVVTKIDRVDAERLAEVSHLCLALLPQNTPSYAVSNTGGQGIPDLRDALDREARDWRQHRACGHFRMSVDRSFHLKGTGLVVTGTVSSGSTVVGDTITLQPQGKTLRVRSIHAQDQAADLGSAGQRCALNVAGNVPSDAISTGDWLVGEGAPGPTSRIDVRLELLANVPFTVKHLTPVKLYIGAKRIAARLFLIRSETGEKFLDPGDSALVQLIIDGSIVCCRGDRFLLRDDSETVTLAGGSVLDAQAPKRGKFRPARLAHLEAQELASPAQAIAAMTIGHSTVVDYSAFKANWNLNDQEATALLGQDSLANVKLVEAGDESLLVSTQRWADSGAAILAELASWHDAHSAEVGIKPAELKQSMEQQGLPGSLFMPVVSDLLRREKLRLAEAKIQLSGRSAQVPKIEEEGWRKIEAIFHRQGRQIPLVSEIQAESGLAAGLMTKIFRRQVQGKQLVKLNDKRYALPAELQSLAAVARDLAASAEGLSVIHFRNTIGCGRRLAIEVLEYFDAARFTQRRDQERIILDKEFPEQFFSR